MADISTLVDAYYKSQMPLTDKYGDLFIEILGKQQLLKKNYLESQPVKQTLKLFRGFSAMTDKNLSEENKKGVHKLMTGFVQSDFASKEITPTMWLSVIDTTEKCELDDLNEYSRAMFY